MLGMLLATLLACNGDDPGPTGDTDTGPVTTVEDCETSPLRYDTFAQPLLATWCTPCHNSALDVAERSGAPEGLDFDSYTDVAAYAALASQSITDERMPPAGGLSIAAREDFAFWVDCGMPEGDAIDTTPALCEAPVSVSAEAVDCTDATQAMGVEIDGDLGSVDGDASCICAVTGDLTASASITYENLRRVDGHVQIDTPEVEMPALADVGSLALLGATGRVQLDGVEVVHGDVVIDDTQLARVELPRLDVVEGDLVVTGNMLLTQGARFANVTELHGSFRFADNDAFPAQVLFGHLEFLGGDIDVQGNDALVSIVGLGHLVELGGRLQIRENPSLELVNLGIDLERIGHGLVIIGNPGLGIVETFPALSSIGMDGTPDAADPGTTDLFLIANTNLRSFTAVPALTELGGLYLASHLRLGTLGDMPLLATVPHDMVIENTRDLTAPPSVPALSSVGGDLRIAGNNSIDTLAPLAAITAIGGDLELVGNESLSTAFAQTFADGVTVGGTTTVSGNGP